MRGPSKPCGLARAVDWSADLRALPAVNQVVQHYLSVRPRDDANVFGIARRLIPAGEKFVQTKNGVSALAGRTLATEATPLFSLRSPTNDALPCLF